MMKFIATGIGDFNHGYLIMIQNVPNQTEWFLWSDKSDLFYWSKKNSYKRF